MNLRLLFTGVLSTCFIALGAQSFKAKMYNPQFNFYEVVAEAEAYFEEHGAEEGSGKKGFERWRYQNERKFYPSGNRTQVDFFIASRAFKKLEAQSEGSAASPQWRELGPSTLGTITGHYSPGLGRVEDFYINPANEQQMYLGSRSGGFWRSTNGGQTWSASSTDFLVASGVNTIAVSPSNADSVLINVRNAENGTSHGVYRSVDGGQNWTQSAFNPQSLGWGGLGSSQQVYIIRYHPLVPNKVFVGTSRGLYYSADNLQTYTQILSGSDITDIDFHPTDSSVVYVYDNYSLGPNEDRVLISTNGGTSFSPSVNLTGNNSATLHIAVSPACPNCVYLASSRGVWKSTNQGQSFTALTKPAGVCDGFAVHDADTTSMIYGMLDIYRSNTAGQSWAQSAWWALGNGITVNGGQYVHADLREAKCINGNFYIATDGFLSKSTDKGLTWQILSDHTAIRENYSLGQSQNNDARVICGSQDNGTSIHTENGWLEFYGADGMEGIIHPLNDDYLIGSVQYGTRRRSTDGGFSQSGVTPNGQSGAWVAPLAYNPINQMEVYSFGDIIYRSQNFGSGWQQIGNPNFTGTIKQAALAENNGNIMMVANGLQIELSTDGGQSFSNRRRSVLPTSYITDIAFDPRHDSTVIITYGSYQNDGKKIFISHDLGNSWTNITGNLGDMPLLSVVIDHQENPNIYVGAEIGVYTKPLHGGTWSLYNTALPNCSMNELEIMYGTNSLRGATWGRGLWETDLKGRSNYPKIKTVDISTPPTLYRPKEGVEQHVFAEIDYAANLGSVFVKFGIDTIALDSSIAMQILQGNQYQSVRPIPLSAEASRVYFKVFAIGAGGDTTETYRYMYEVKKAEYCAAAGASNTTANWISNVQLANLNNGSSKSAYSDFTNQYVILEHDSTYQIEVTMNHSWDPDTVYAWIDFDENLEFDAYELIQFGPINAQHKSVGIFTTPPWVGTDTLRLRVRSRYFHGSAEPCDTLTGEVEDYSVILNGSGIGLAEKEVFAPQIVPNPASELVNLKFSENVGRLKVELYTLSGALLKTQTWKNGREFKLDLNGIADGLYLLNYEHRHGRSSEKLLIKKL